MQNSRLWDQLSVTCLVGKKFKLDQLDVVFFLIFITLEYVCSSMLAILYLHIYHIKDIGKRNPILSNVLRRKYSTH